MPGFAGTLILPGSCSDLRAAGFMRKEIESRSDCPTVAFARFVPRTRDSDPCPAWRCRLVRGHRCPEPPLASARGSGPGCQPFGWGTGSAHFWPRNDVCRLWHHRPIGRGTRGAYRCEARSQLNLGEGESKHAAAVVRRVVHRQLDGGVNRPERAAILRVLRSLAGGRSPPRLPQATSAAAACTTASLVLSGPPRWARRRPAVGQVAVA